MLIQNLATITLNSYNTKVQKEISIVFPIENSDEKYSNKSATEKIPFE